MTSFTTYGKIELNLLNNVNQFSAGFTILLCTAVIFGFIFFRVRKRMTSKYLLWEDAFMQVIFSSMLRSIGSILAMDFQYIKSNCVSITCIKTVTDYGMYFTLCLFVYYGINVFWTINTPNADAVVLLQRIKIQLWDDKRLCLYFKYKWIIFVSIWLSAVIIGIFESMIMLSCENTDYDYSTWRVVRVCRSILFVLVALCSCVYLVSKYFKVRSRIAIDVRIQLRTLTVTLLLNICVLIIFELGDAFRAAYTMFNIVLEKEPPLSIGVFRYILAPGNGVIFSSIYLIYKSWGHVKKQFAIRNRRSGANIREQHVMGVEMQTIAPNDNNNGTRQSLHTYSSYSDVNGRQVHPRIDSSTINTRDDVLEMS